MKTSVFCSSIVFLLAAATLFVPPSQAQGVPASPSSLPPMNPAMLLRLRDQLTYELRQTERTLGFIDPSDAALTATLKEQQTELVNQLKEITTRLKAQGIPVEGEPDAASAALPIPRVPTESSLPVLPRAADPTLVPGGVPQPATDPNLLIQRPPGTPIPGMPAYPMSPGFEPAIDGSLPSRPQTPTPTPVPTPFDQDRAWADSPWAPQPSRELSELKQTVDVLRREITDMRETIKALETQIQLLNRNILLSQPAARQP